MFLVVVPPMSVPLQTHHLLKVTARADAFSSLRRYDKRWMSQQKNTVDSTFFVSTVDRESAEFLLLIPSLSLFGLKGSYLRLRLTFK